jgi:hypothetical protein
MAKMILFENEWIRINPLNKYKIEYSINDGIDWKIRYLGSDCGKFEELNKKELELLATTTKGQFVSKNKGISWIKI